MKKFTAPQMCYLERDRNLGFGNNCSITPESAQQLDILLGLLSKIKPTKDEDTWQFWVKVPRGGIEDFGDYDELHEYGEYSSYDEFEKDWQEWFPKEVYWYEITVVSRNGYILIIANNAAVMSIEPNNKSADCRDLVDFLQFLIDEVSAIIDGLKAGKYNAQISAMLPMEYKMGVIERKVLWEIVPEAKENAQDGLSDDEIAVFVKNCADNKTDGAAESLTNRIESMTANKYYDICATCYKAARLDEIENKSAKEMYRRYADERDGGLSMIDAESSEEFDKWYSSDDSKKWELHNPSHMWEIVAGSTHTRIHLYVYKDSGEYYFALTGGVHTRTAEVVRMYNALKADGIPVYIYDHKNIRNRLLGTDEVGIVPATDTPSQYWYGGFPKDNISTFIRLSEDEFTDEEIYQIILHTKWFDLPQLFLKEEK